MLSSHQEEVGAAEDSSNDVAPSLPSGEEQEAFLVKTCKQMKT